MDLKRFFVILLVTIIHVSLVIIPADASEERLSVSSDIANIRSGPGTTFKVLWQIEKYHPVVIIQKKGNWYQFKDFENDRGWVHSSLLSDIDTVITKKSCNIRSGAGTEHKIVFTAEKGIPLKVLKRNTAWLHVQHADGDKGWIFKSLVW